MSHSWPEIWPADLASVLALTPHPDDELFCAGLLARAARGGARVTVACATGGGRGWVFGKRAPGDEVIELRAAELEAACAALGASAVIQLGFPDGGLDRDAAAAIAATIDDVAADLIVSFAPDGGYGHRDHVALVEMIEAALADREPRPRWLQRVFARGAFSDTVASMRQYAPELLADVALGGQPADWVVDAAPTEAARRDAHAAHASQRWMLDDLEVLFSSDERYVEA